MFLEVIFRALALDFNFFIGLAMNNLFWIFALGAAAYFLGSSKSWLWNFITLTLMLYALSDLFPFFGWSFGANGLTLMPVYVFIFQMTLMKWFNGFEFLGSYAKYVILIFFFSVASFCNLFGWFYWA